MNPKTKRKSKSNGSSKFLRCCRPKPLDINMNDAVSVKQRVVLPRVLPATAVAAAASAASLCGDDDDKENISIKEKNDLQITKKMKKKKKNKGNHPRLLGILKAIFFETSVARKIRERKNKQKMRQTNYGNEKSIHNKELPEVDYNINNGSIVSNNTSSLCSSSALITSSSSTACSSSFSSKSSSDTNKSFGLVLPKTIERKQKGIQRQHGKGYYGPNVGLCLILISLLILIIWGKLCAIFCTSTWLFFGARRRIDNPSSSHVDSRRIDSEEYKKKIIMEGLLIRDHPRPL